MGTIINLLRHDADTHIQLSRYRVSEHTSNLSGLLFCKLYHAMSNAILEGFPPDQIKHGLIEFRRDVQLKLHQLIFMALMKKTFDAQVHIDL